MGGTYAHHYDLIFLTPTTTSYQIRIILYIFLDFVNFA